MKLLYEALGLERQEFIYKESIRNQFEPRKCKSRKLQRLYLDKHLCHIVEDKSLSTDSEYSFLVEQT